MATASPRRLLLVEDTKTDAYLLRRALEESGIAVDARVIEDGEKALAYIDNLAPEECPHLVVIDLNIPRYDGLEVLKRCRSKPCLAGVIVVILTSSESLRDRKRAERLGVTAFLIKPMDLDEFLALGNTLGKFLTA